MVLLDLNGILVRCPPNSDRLIWPDDQPVVEIRREAGNQGHESWAYTRPDEVRELIDFLTEKLPGQWGIYSTMIRRNAYSVVRDVFQIAGRPIMSNRPSKRLAHGHPAGRKWLWFFSQEDHHEHDLEAPCFLNSGHRPSLLSPSVASDVEEWLQTRGLQARVAPMLVVAACKKTKLVWGKNLLIEDYDDEAVEGGKKTGLKRVEAAVRMALADPNGLGNLLREANTNFLFRRRLKGLAMPHRLRGDQSGSSNHNDQSPDVFRTIDGKILDFLDPFASAEDA